MNDAHLTEGGPLCPDCGEPSHRSDGVFVCRNESCPEFGQVVAPAAGSPPQHHGSL